MIKLSKTLINPLMIGRGLVKRGVFSWIGEFWLKGD